MAKRKRQSGKYAQNLRAKEGRGLGRGAHYKPYLYIHDVPSMGLASRVWGWKTRRVHHFLSRLELKFFYTQEWPPDVIDIREQFPLDLEETLAIADQLGIRHPSDPRTKDHIVMTSDFVLTIKKHFDSEDIIRTTKYWDDLDNERTKEKLRIEEVYWKETRGMDWEIATERDIDANLAANIEWVHGFRDFESLTPLTVAQFIQVEALLAAMLQTGGRLRDLTDACDSHLGLEVGSSLSVVRHLVANRRLDVEMTTHITPSLPLTLVNKPLLKAVVGQKL